MESGKRVTRVSKHEKTSVIRGNYVYKSIWTFVIEEQMDVIAEKGNKQSLCNCSDEGWQHLWPHITGPKYTLCMGMVNYHVAASAYLHRLVYPRCQFEPDVYSRGAFIRGNMVHV